MTGWRGGGIIRVELGRVVARKIEGCREVGLARRGSGAMQARYTDFRGNEVLHDGASPVSWRVSVHTIVIVEGSLLLMEPQYSEASELPGGEVLTGETLGKPCSTERGVNAGKKPVTPSNPSTLRPPISGNNGTSRTRTGASGTRCSSHGGGPYCRSRTLGGDPLLERQEGWFGCLPGA